MYLAGSPAARCWSCGPRWRAARLARPGAGRCAPIRLPAPLRLSLLDLPLRGYGSRWVP